MPTLSGHFQSGNSGKVLSCSRILTALHSFLTQLRVALSFLHGCRLCVSSFGLSSFLSSAWLTTTLSSSPATIAVIFFYFYLLFEPSLFSYTLSASSYCNCFLLLSSLQSNCYCWCLYLLSFSRSFETIFLLLPLVCLLAFFNHLLLLFAIHGNADDNINVYIYRSR